MKTTFILFSLIAWSAFAADQVAIKFYAPDNKAAIPTNWPAVVQPVKDGQLPAGFSVLMTQAQLDAYVKANESTYKIWESAKLAAEDKVRTDAAAAVSAILEAVETFDKTIDWANIKPEDIGKILKAHNDILLRLLPLLKRESAGDPGAPK